MSTTTADPLERDTEQAIAILWHELDSTVNLAMNLVDLIDGAQQDDRKVNTTALRAAVARKLRASVEARDAALAPFGIDGGAGHAA